MTADRERAQVVLDAVARVCFDERGYGVAGQKLLARMTGFTPSQITDVMPLAVAMCNQQYPGHALQLEGNRRDGYVYRIVDRTSPSAKRVIVTRWKQAQTKHSRVRDELLVRNATATEQAALAIIGAMNQQFEIVERMLVDSGPSGPQEEREVS